MEYFNFLCGNVRIDPRCTRGIKASIAVAEAAFNKKNFFFYLLIGLKFMEEISEVLLLERSFVWC